VRDGEIWGRGALDMKGQVAANAVAIASLAREGFQPAGDLIFAATADEEVGDGFGLQWLCEDHPDAVRCDYAVNEGGGDRLDLGNGIYYNVLDRREDDRAVQRARARALGPRVHAGIADNALVKAARLIERLAAYRFEPQVEPEVEAFLRTVLGDVPPAESVLERARALHPLAAEVVDRCSRRPSHRR